MQARIEYRLSQTGRKANVLAGGDGKEIQEVTVARDAPEFTAVVEQGTVTNDGAILLDLTRVDHNCEPCWPTQWDHVPSLAELLADLPTRRQRKADQDAAKESAVRDATLAVLRERRTIQRNNSIYQDGMYTHYVYPIADWPYHRDKGVIDSPEARSWQAELDAAKESARQAAQVEADRKSAEERAKAESAARAETERRASLGLGEGDLDLDIEDGALTEVPSGMWETHKRGSNWMAVITPRPTAPGGLERDFAERAKGDAYYLIPANLQPGEAIEFGADYTSGGGNKSRKRWYGYVVRVDSDRLILHECDTGKSAIKAGLKHREEMTTDATKTTEATP